MASLSDNKIHHKLRIKIFVFNNRGYTLIKQTQDTWLGGRYSGVNKDSGLSLPNNLKIANSYGIKSIYIKNNNDLKKKLLRIINTRGPVLVDLNIDPSCRIEPKLDYGRALHDMSPKLPAEEIKNNMKN
jgi:acetolactate synthase-1/2/3 large subunit